ncbi:MAG: AmmeMemoRadiSam system protein B [Ilumatobacteraceae bacterium]
MTRVRPPALAGTFYPADPAVLARMIDALLAAARPPDEPQVPTGPPVAVIAPHAGYVYSGPVAATAYAVVRPWRQQIRRVVLVGVPHRAPVSGLALSSAAAWATPLGHVEVDTEACAALAARPGVVVDDRAHAEEHSLEVHLPFLQQVLGTGWQLVPVIAGGPGTAAIADALTPWWAEEGTLVVVSTDLSHYHPLREAKAIDLATAEAIVGLRWESLDSEQACGVSGVRAVLELCVRHGQRVRLLDLRTSGDTAGPEDRVVGYGSFAIR